MKRFRGFVVGVACGAILMVSVPVAAKAGKQAIEVVYNNIKLEVKGIRTKMPQGVEPFIYNGTTYLPVRAVAEALGEEVSYDKKTATVHVGSSNQKEVLHSITDKELISILDEGVGRWLNFLYAYEENYKTYKEYYATIDPKFNSYKKIEDYLSPYWSKSVIKDFLGDWTVEKDGVLYMKLGDAGMTPDYKKGKIVERIETDNLIKIKVEAYDFIEVSYTNFTLALENGKWVIKDTDIADLIGIR